MYYAYDQYTDPPKPRIKKNPYETVGNIHIFRYIYIINHIIA